MVQRNAPVGRTRLGKRLLQVSDDDDTENLPGPVTLTVTSNRLPVSSSPVITPTVTVFVPPAGITSLSNSQATSSSSAPPRISSSSDGALTSLKPAPTPSVSVNDSSAEPNPVAPSGGVSSHGIPTGSIVGIVLAIVLFLVAAAVFFFRRRAVARRLKLRGWAGNPRSSPPFLWVEPKEATGVTPYPNTSFAPQYRGETSVRQTYSGGPIQPAPYAAPANNGLPFIPPPAPPPPPPAAGLYDYPPSPPASAPSALTPGGSNRARVPGSSAPGEAPAAGNKPLVETAKVRSTFIPTLPDELSISTGEVIRVHEEYDDGWALCSNARGEKGMVPLECLDRGSVPSEAAREYKKLARVSSLAASPSGGFQ
ncbi:putative src homology 3 domains containing protein [Lyophyllum shimeji]|uniref:Src homology 3 domains containing protein n=1 Tax=Lyophyllum shimeji TaxID=47721 RepID=A0A9P3PFS8_LYOSH|nr:putative src homology 3 domains containing protein [Lyophyllum shimeji]